MIDALDALSEKAATGLAWLAGAFLVAMMLLACANMVVRFFDAPIKGAFELMGFMGAATAAFSLAFAQRQKAHIAVGILLKRFPKPVRRLADAVAFAASAAFFGLCGIETWKWADFLVLTGEVSETLQIVYHPFVFAASAGCFVFAFILAVDALKILSGKQAVE